MDRLTRLYMAGRSTYYLGWITAFAAALVHFARLDRILVPVSLSTRNLLEASVIFFLACAASELRVLDIAATGQMPRATRGQAA
jgi:hypothetical protein